MTSLPKYLREEAVRALNRAAKLTEDSFPLDARYFEQTAARIAPAKRVKKPMQKARESRKKIERTDENAETARIRGACMARSGGFCECGCGRRWTEGGFLLKAEMDEWLNGNGRRRQKRAIATCWILTATCHEQRQRYRPDVAHWNEKFAAHCAKHHYVFTPHIEHTKISARPARTA